MRQFYSVFIFTAFSLFLFSCKNKDAQDVLLKQAQEIMEDKPSEALKMLDSIPRPQVMDKDLYMQYIVARVQAKCKLYQDIANDTLIYEAEKYFREKENFDQTAIANFYIGYLHWDKKGTNEKAEALKAFYEAKYYAAKSGNDLLIGKALHCIGQIYYSSFQHDKAIHNFKEALKYPIEDNAKNGALSKIGFSYGRKDLFDSALVYFSKSLKLANETDNNGFKTDALQGAGQIYYYMEKTDSALIFTKRALQIYEKGLYKNRTEYLRILVNMANIYHETNQFDSAKYYLDFVTDSIPVIKNDVILKGVYSALFEHHRDTGNPKEAIKYKKIADSLYNKVLRHHKEVDLTEAEKKYEVSILEHEAQLAQNRYQLYIAFVVIVLLLFAVFALIRHSRGMNEINKLTGKTEALEEVKKILDSQVLSSNEIVEKLDVFIEQERMIHAKALGDGSVAGNIGGNVQTDHSVNTFHLYNDPVVLEEILNKLSKQKKDNR